MPRDALTAIYQAHPAAQKFFDWITQAELEEQRTTVEEVIEQCGIARRPAINLLRALADGGFGEFKVGRKGHPSRFEWAEDPQQLAKRLEHVGDGDEHDDENGGDPPDPSGNARPRASNGPGNGELFVDMFSSVQAAESPASSRQPARSHELEAELIEHSYVLRPKLRVVVKLPADLSAREAEVLGNWIRELSFER